MKRAQDHLDCLSAFEEHFLEQENHWAAMVKVRKDKHNNLLLNSQQWVVKQAEEFIVIVNMLCGLYSRS